MNRLLFVFIIAVGILLGLVVVGGTAAGLHIGLRR